ncbi:MAG: LysM peptidoglycan-binding domain-containing protein [Acidimicrobiales bacterium]
MIDSGRLPADRARRANSALPAWMALGGAIVVLHAAGGVLPAPPLGTPSAWSTWMVGRDPVVVAFGLVRLLGLGAAWYSVAVSAIGVGLRLVSARHLASLVDHVTAVPLRRLVSTTVAVAISAAPIGTTAAHALTPAGAVSVETVSVETVSVETVPVETVPTEAVTATTEAPPPTITMHLESPAATAGPPVAQASPPQPSPATTTPAPEAPPPTSGSATAAAEATWTVRPGQCFWSIAEAELSRAWGRAPTSAEIVPYWHRLIEANRSALADPANADLIFAGQVFALPAP